MVSRKLLVQINQRFIELFGSTNELLFGELSVIVCGDLHQLPPVNSLALHTRFNDINNLPLKDDNGL